MSGVTGVAVGAAVVGTAASAYAADKSASASKKATNSTIAEQQREYDQTRADQAPYRELGSSAIDQLRKLYGYDNGGTPDFSGFTTSPDYQFAQQQGQQAIDRSAAARGGLLSGAAVKSGERFASGLASQQYGDYFNRLAAQAGLGQTGTQATSAAGANAANNIGNAYLQNAANQSQSAYTLAGGVNQAVQGGASNYLLSKYLGTNPYSSYGSSTSGVISGLNDDSLFAKQPTNFGSPFGS